MTQQSSTSNFKPTLQRSGTAARPSRRTVFGFILLLGISVLFAVWNLQHQTEPEAVLPSKFVQAKSNIQTVRFSRGGRFIVTTGHALDDVVTLWNSQTLRPVHQWSGRDIRIFFSEDDNQFLVKNSVRSKGMQFNYKLYDATSGRILRQWNSKGAVRHANHDLSLVIIGKGTDKAYLQETATGRIRGDFFLGASVGAETRFTQNGHHIIVPSYKNPAQLLRTSDLTPVLPLPELRNLYLSSDEQRVVGVQENGTLHVWQLPSRQHHTLTTGLTFVRRLYQLKDNSLVIFGNTRDERHSQNIIQLRSPDGAQLLHSSSFAQEPEFVSPGGDFVASKVPYKDEYGLSHGITKYFDVFNIRSGERVARLDVGFDPLGEPTSPPFSQKQLRISPNGKRFIFTTGDGLLRFYNLNAQERWQLPQQILLAKHRIVLQFGKRIFNAMVLPEGGVIATGMDKDLPGHYTIRTSPAQGTEQVLKTDAYYLDDAIIGTSPNGQRVAVVSRSGVWERDGSIPSTTPLQRKGYSVPVAGHPVWLNGNDKPFSVLSTSSYKTGAVMLNTWDAQRKQIGSREIVPRFKQEAQRYFRFSRIIPSPDGHKVLILWNEVEKSTRGKEIVDVVGDVGLSEVRETRTGRVLTTLQLTTSHYGIDRDVVTWSPDGKRIAMSDNSGRIQLFNALTGKRETIISGVRAQPVNRYSQPSDFSPSRLAFMPDGRFLAAGYKDGSIYLYSLQSLLPVVKIGQAAGEIRWMQFSQDGRTLYGYVRNGKSIFAWDIPEMKGSVSEAKQKVL